MTAEVLYAGGELDSVEIVNGAPSSALSRFAVPYSRQGIFVGGPGEVFRIRTYNRSTMVAAAFSAPDNIFIHYVRNKAGAFNGSFTNWVTVRDSAGNPWVAIRTSTSATPNIALYGNTGTGASPTWTKLSSDRNYGANTNITDDLRILLDAGGAHTLEWSIDQSSTGVFTFTQALFTNVAMVDFSTHDFDSGCTYSQFVITRNQSTIGGHVYTSALDADTARAAWTGAFGDINETGLSDTTNLQTAASNDISTFTTSDIATPVGYVIPDAWIWTRAKQSGVTPTNCAVVMRVGSTNYATTLTQPGNSYSNIPLALNTNPATSGAWDDTAWNAAERGVKSLA